MIAPRRCPKGRHRVLLVEQWTAMGAVVSCLDCSYTFHMESPVLARDFFGFEHVSPEGPQADKAVFIDAKYLDGEAKDGS